MNTAQLSTFQPAAPASVTESFPVLTIEDFKGLSRLSQDLLLKYERLARKKGYAYIGLSALMDQLRASDRGIQKAQGKLVALGIIRIETQHEKSGRQTVNKVYVLKHSPYHKVTDIRSKALVEKVPDTPYPEQSSPSTPNAVHPNRSMTNKSSPPYPPRGRGLVSFRDKLRLKLVSDVPEWGAIPHELQERWLDYGEERLKAKGDVTSPVGFAAAVVRNAIREGKVIELPKKPVVRNLDEERARTRLVSRYADKLDWQEAVKVVEKLTYAQVQEELNRG